MGVKMKLDLAIGDDIYDEMVMPGIAGKVIDIEGCMIVIDFEGDVKYAFIEIKATGEIDYPPNLSKTPYKLVGLTPICVDEI